MPYVAIKAYPKDEATKKLIAEKIARVFEENWGCPREAISISIEEIAPEKWEDTVMKTVVWPDFVKLPIGILIALAGLGAGIWFRNRTARQEAQN